MHTLIEFAASFDAKQTEITMKFQVFVLHGNIHITHIPTSVVANDEYRQFYILFLYYNVPCKIEYYAISSYYKHYGQNHKTLYTFFIPILHSWNSITRAKKWKRTEKKQNDNINNEKLIWANVKTVCVNWKRIFCFFLSVAVAVATMMMMMAENLISKWKLIIMKILQFENFVI